MSDLEVFASRKGATPAQIALAWLMAQNENVFPIPGCKSRKHIDENLDAVDITLSKDELNHIEEIFPKNSVSGTRYPEEGMQRVNL